MIKSVIENPDQAREYIKLAHLSDPHMSSLQDIKWQELLNKRILGYLSWYWRRRFIHSREILAILQHELDTLQPDHIIISGDLTHLGTHSECLEAKTWLQTLGLPDNLTLVPGNHDCYVQSEWQDTIGQWESYMVGDAGSLQGNTASIFPAIRRRGPIALIGLSTAHPTAPFLASGSLGKTQLSTLEKILVTTAHQGLFRVVILHHGLLPGTSSRRRGLDDADDLLAILEKYGAELVLHGHGHKSLHGLIRTSRTDIPVFGVPSASSTSDTRLRCAGYNIYEVEAIGSEWVLHIKTRILESRISAFEDSAEYKFTFPRINRHTAVNT